MAFSGPATASPGSAPGRTARGFRALHGVLKLWIDGIYTRKQAVFNITQKGASAMEAINGRILQLDPPAKAPAIVSDKGKWTYG